MAAHRAALLADRPGGLVGVRPLRHVPLAAEPDGFYRYNSLQHLAYFAVVFVMPPLSILTGLAMSPAVDNHF